MQITRGVLTDMGVSHADADKYLDQLNEAMGKHGITSGLRIAHFLAQIVHESAHMKAVEENLNYSADGLLRTFPRHFWTRDLAVAYARKPEKIANRVYGGRMGNGSESSGDGFRYRGRGLVQLTGKNNYKAFSGWMGHDCVADPDAVVERFAAYSAVFYWDTNNLSRLADIDDLKAVTLRVNGGLNGLAERMQLLQQAKRSLRVLGTGAAAAPALSSDPLSPVAPAFVPTHLVVPQSLNLRREPRVSPANLIASLAQGTPVAQQGAAADWANIRVMLSGSLREGYVSAQFLSPLPRGASFAVEASALAVVAPPPARLAAGRREMSRAHDGGRAYPLGEAGRPRLTAKTPTTRAAQLIASIAWLDCEDPAHRRYRPKGRASYANTYCADYCDLAGVYLPRVWWTADALARIAAGQRIDVAFDRTVRGLSTNTLFEWLEDYGTAFGWQREIDLLSLQTAANAGEVCVIIAKAKDLSRPGHMVAVVPEHEGCQAKRDKDGDCLRPVESQCGRKNVRCATAASAWWLADRFQGHAFWRHPG